MSEKSLQNINDLPLYEPAKMGEITIIRLPGGFMYVYRRSAVYVATGRPVLHTIRQFFKFIFKRK